MAEVVNQGAAPHPEDTSNWEGSGTPSEAHSLPRRLIAPLLPLAGSVVFPRSVHPLELQGEHARSLLNAAEQGDGLVALFLQDNQNTAAPAADDLRRIGTLARLTDARSGVGDRVELVAEGLAKARLVAVREWEPHASAEVELLEEPAEDGHTVEQLAEQARNLYKGLVAADPAAGERLLPVLEQTHDALDLAYLIASTIPIAAPARQSVLESEGASTKLLQVIALMGKLFQTSATVQLQAAGESSGIAAPEPQALPPGTGGRAQRRHLDQVAIDRETLEKRLRELPLPPEAAHVVERELERLSLLSPTSPDYNLVRTYLQWLADLPWHGGEEPEFDLDRARQVLDREHYGLTEVKERIIEHLAVHKLRRERGAPRTVDLAGADEVGGDSREVTQPVLCLVGPPGVGKTSLGRSIAEALNRPFVRISLGGVSDEAEIRGHRRTYLGAMPGRIIQALARLQDRQPVMMLDELDKLGSGTKGDPTAALLEVLDPEQQREFIDHYIDVPFDISSVFFIATANTLDAVPEALRDRLEVIRLSSYTEEEKAEIALRHIIPKQMAWHALHEGDLRWEPSAVLEMIRSYTREAGVRQLEREIATICRRVAAMVAERSRRRRPYRATPQLVAEVLGTPRFLPPEPEATDQPGVVTAVFWTPVGGDVMQVEAIAMPGRKTLTITGQLGEVMRESAQAALSYVRASAEQLGIDPRFYEQYDIHLHIPSGAVPKDGPSAGVALAAALVSALTKVPVSGEVAMTGELTLRGRVLPVGGVKEKVLAARRAGIQRVILPAQNRRDLDEVPAEILSEVQTVWVETMEDVLEAAFGSRFALKEKKKRARSRRGANVSPLPGAARPRAG